MTKPRMKNVKSGSAPQYTAMSDVYSFGDPEACLDSRLTDYVGVFSDHNGIYAPPINLQGLVKLLRVNAQHGPILGFKRNMILKWFKPNSILSNTAFKKFAYDYLWSGNAYLQIIRNKFDQIIRLKHLPALNMRYTTERGVYAQLSNRTLEPIRFNIGEVIHIKEYDPAQGIYGIPEYYGGIQSALLNEDATLFRRRYYKNGAHMGFIFSMADPNLSEEDEKMLKDAISKSKGVGNFNSLFFNFKTNGVDADKAIKITPVGDISTKDEFERIKQITLNDMLSMHRAQEALSGQRSGEKAGFGDLDKITRSYYNNEVVPLQQTMRDINLYLPAHLYIDFSIPEYSDLYPNEEAA
ncbi:phage portal protein [Pseudoalteromonas luteoviolacea]|uniref:phage portal protein n=1 Tax=Pseudoalteromonas luteoviolacea TaxID=43657 RepID=UPI001F1CD714|nr:phage portal protein [Pseudoalteromonas luteoviolacea]MCF6442341.1 phage portal protein [Pseudoalteromonas luteoviolacea]